MILVYLEILRYSYYRYHRYLDISLEQQLRLLMTLSTEGCPKLWSPVRSVECNVVSSLLTSETVLGWTLVITTRAPTESWRTIIQALNLAATSHTESYWLRF